MNPNENHGAFPNLYLIGFMGTGKSSSGKLSAQKIGLQFIDSDQEIEKTSGLSIRTIFETQGEERFREFEKDFILTGHSPSGNLISCGGGLPIPQGMIETLKSKGMVLCLWASPESILKRTSGNSSRPLLQSDDPRNKIEKLLREREERYRLADRIISTDDKSEQEVADDISKYYLESLHWIISQISFGLTPGIPVVVGERGPLPKQMHASYILTQLNQYSSEQYIQQKYEPWEFF